jgi:NhaP-type Na+/H+ or K+/H+ antiporter
LGIVALNVVIGSSDFAGKEVKMVFEAMGSIAQGFLIGIAIRVFVTATVIPQASDELEVQSE